KTSEKKTPEKKTSDKADKKAPDKKTIDKKSSDKSSNKASKQATSHDKTTKPTAAPERAKASSRSHSGPLPLAPAAHTSAGPAMAIAYEPPATGGWPLATASPALQPTGYMR